MTTEDRKTFPFYGYCQARYNPIVNGECNCEVPNCWAMAMCKRFKGQPGWADGFYPERLDKISLTGKPKVIVIQYLGDIAHPKAPDAEIIQIITKLEKINNIREDDYYVEPHQLLILTKHPKRLWDIIHKNGFCSANMEGFWFGTSAGSQKMYDKRIVELMKFKQAGFKVGLSLEPIEGHIILNYGIVNATELLDQIIIGGNSEHKKIAPDLDIYRSIRDQCAEAGVPFFLKQFNDHKLLPELDGVVHDELAWR